MMIKMKMKIMMMILIPYKKLTMTFYPVFILNLKNRFDNLFRKYITYTGGEELFGLPVTQYPQLLDIKKQLVLLQKLYGLYNTVIETVNGYYDILWADINIENINNELLDFQTRFLSLSLSLSKEYKKETINNFFILIYSFLHLSIYF